MTDTIWSGQLFKVIGPTPLPKYCCAYDPIKNAWRLEARKGDKRTEDVHPVERVGLDAWPAPMDRGATNVTDFYYTPGVGSRARAEGDWLAFYETHCLPDGREYEPAGPLGFMSEWSAYGKCSRFRVWLRSLVLDTSGKAVNVSARILFDDVDLAEGTKYHFVIHENFDDVAGVLKIWRNAKLIVDYKGPYGYGASRKPYRCMRIYRNTRSYASVASFIALSLSRVG